MNIEEYRSFCLSLGSDIEERMPFGAFKAAQGVLAFYVKGHIFSYFNIDNFTIVNLKCQPDRILSLKEQYPCISNPYNMSSKHWIGVNPTMAIPASPFSHREFLSACKTEIHEVFLNNRSRLSLIAKQTAFFMYGDLSTSKGIVREG